MISTDGAIHYSGCTMIAGRHKAFRGQQLLNRNMPIETVSPALGHTSTRTTETYYCRKDADSARLEILRAFEGGGKRSECKNPEIETKTQLTSYA